MRRIVRVVSRCREHPIKERVHGPQHHRVQIHVHHGRVIRQRVRFQFDQFAFPTASIVVNLFSQPFPLDIFDGDGRVALHQGVAKTGQGLGTLFSLGMINGVHFVVVATTEIAVDRRQVNRVFQDGRAFGNGIGATAGNGDGPANGGDCC